MKLDELIMKLTELRDDVDETKDVQIVMGRKEPDGSEFSSVDDIGEIFIIDGVLCIERVI